MAIKEAGHYDARVDGRAMIAKGVEEDRGLLCREASFQVESMSIFSGSFDVAM